MLRVSPQALDGFRASAVEGWAIDTAQFLARTYLDYIKALQITAEDLLPIVYDVHGWAARQECSADRDVRQLCCLAVSLGHRFWRDPRFAHYVQTTVQDRTLTRSKAVKALVGHGTEWLGTLWQDDSVGNFGERMCALIVGGYPVTAVNLNYVLPGHAAMFSEDDQQRFLMWLSPRLPQTGHAHQRLSYVCMAMAFGARWWEDPQYRVLAHHVSAQSDPQGLVNRILPMFRDMP